MHPFCHCNKSPTPSTWSVWPCFHPEKWFRNYNSETTPRQPSSDSTFTDWSIEFFTKQILYLQGSFFSTSQRTKLDELIFWWCGHFGLAWSCARYSTNFSKAFRSSLNTLINLVSGHMVMLRKHLFAENNNLTSEAFTSFSNSQTLQSFTGLVTYASIIYV